MQDAGRGVCADRECADQRDDRSPDAAGAHTTLSAHWGRVGVPGQELGGIAKRRGPPLLIRKQGPAERGFWFSEAQKPIENRRGIWYD